MLHSASIRCAEKHLARAGECLGSDTEAGCISAGTAVRAASAILQEMDTETPQELNSKTRLLGTIERIRCAVLARLQQDPLGQEKWVFHQRPDAIGDFTTHYTFAGIAAEKQAR